MVRGMISFVLACKLALGSILCCCTMSIFLDTFLRSDPKPACCCQRHAPITESSPRQKSERQVPTQPCPCERGSKSYTTHASSTWHVPSHFLLGYICYRQATEVATISANECRHAARDGLEACGPLSHLHGRSMLRALHILTC